MTAAWLTQGQLAEGMELTRVSCGLVAPLSPTALLVPRNPCNWSPALEVKREHGGRVPAGSPTAEDRAGPKAWVCGTPPLDRSSMTELTTLQIQADPASGNP